jgi:hypothetical protein
MDDANGNQLTAGQKAILAADAVASGRMSTEEAVLLFETSKTSLKKAQVIKQRDKNHDVTSAMRRGRISLAVACRRVGLSTTSAPIKSGTSFKRGDKWFQATEPLRRYLQHWGGREYTHINAKEARRRLAVVRELQRSLALIEPELERRSVRATLAIRKDRQ